jgi:hypothetical protein
MTALSTLPVSSFGCVGCLSRARRNGLDEMVRKGGLEPPRYCYRRPLKLANSVCSGGLMRIR